MNNLDVMLKSGAQDMGIALTDEQLHKLRAYVDLLMKWNKVYNLTAIRTPEEMISRHILDSLSVLSYVEAMIPAGGNLIDVGSGPGLPGLPLAIMLPDRNISTLDCVGKKTRFQVQVCNELGLNNVTVLNERVENWQPEQGYDGVISRAFSSLKDMITGTDHLLRKGGLWLAMKGIHPEQELDELHSVRPDVVMTESHPLEVAGCDGQRHLVILERMETAQA
ncbi:16S rRNA (guanine(527)-N(7))-methyltransferase RsmG [Parendozoicomonas haliclonae]|uniref:Ribosomal RNA small subunit methyltransferase G n=1 Tax=Parendozoicomonas haliclonae TaxID=1960125 RepID=A0A1X7AJX5_9GAMM|nr:16S rRNA (guanine(527)-N(7))-methyltransferase RsmG [Parendozoicomonas haliclonae]SMA46539.1 Ribosomal RNA small subunit methyltransferase G [Parendozoicomonas haliclonae]